MAITLKQHLTRIGELGGKQQTPKQKLARAANLKKARELRWPKK